MPNNSFESSDPRRFVAAIARFDGENSADPNFEQIDGVRIPRELVYAQRLTDWVLRLNPGASEELRLAARSQHICRWQIPRDKYPMDRAGYLRWRAELKKFHAQKSGENLRDLGYDEKFIQRVQDLNLKKNFPADPESRVLEDALCLVFLEFQFADLAGKTSEEKTINALRKSWIKMTPAAHEFAKRLPFGPREQALIDKALASV